MARLFATGFEAGSNGIFDLGGVSGGAGVQTSITRGPWSTYALAGGNFQIAGQRSFGAAVSSFYSGFGFFATGAEAFQSISWLSPNGVINLQVITNGSNKLQVRRGTSTVLATSGPSYAVGRWYFVELFGVIHDTTGQIQLRVDGENWIALTTGLDTREDAASGGETCDRWAGPLGTQAGSARIDDLYVNDTTGSVNNGFSGDLRLKAYIPNGAGDSTGLTRGGADSGSNFGQVDERPPNDATDYVYGLNTSSYDLYHLPNSSDLGSVDSVTLWIRAQKNDAGFASIAPMLKSGAVEHQSADQPLSTSWAYHHRVYDLDPTDSNPWTSGKIDALQVGAKSR